MILQTVVLTFVYFVLYCIVLLLCYARYLILEIVVLTFVYFVLYCTVLLLCYARYLILETVVPTFVYFVLYCIVSFVLFVCYVFFLTSFMSDCCMAEFVDLRNDMCVCVCVCVYVIMYECMYVCIGETTHNIWGDSSHIWISRWPLGRLLII